MEKTRAQIIAKKLYDSFHKYSEEIVLAQIELELLKAEFSGFSSAREYLPK